MPKPNAKPHGQVRHSQVVTTFGPGSLVDLPTQSVLVGGLDHWSGVSEEVHEPRLVEKLKRLLDMPALKLFSPPPDNEDPTAPRTGITAWQFPEWFITQDVEAGGQGGMVRSRLLVHRRALTKGKFIDQDKKKHPVVPIRFVRACRKGHIGDIDWYRFAHEKNPKCRRQLWIEERGTSGDIGEIFVRCECGEGAPLVRATIPGSLGHCDGARPWLGPQTKEACADVARLLVRHASNAYFPQVMSVISLPDRNESLEKAVNQVWENFLQYVDTLDELKKERQKKPPVKAALEGFSDDEVLQEIEVRKGTGNEAPIKSVKQAEFDADLNSLAGALRSGRLHAPFAEVSIQRYCPSSHANGIAACLQQLHDEGMKPQHMALLAETMFRTRERVPDSADNVDLVWTGPETLGTTNRDTGVVVRELFGAAESEVLVAGFAVYQGRSVFKRLAERMEERPNLRVKLFLDVRRHQTDTSLDTELLRRFANNFRTQEWPGKTLPDLYYDPRSLDLEAVKRSSLHAKCIVVDRRVSLVTSANFTEAAQMRNIEVGALIRSERFASQLVSHFESLADVGALHRLGIVNADM